MKTNHGVSVKVDENFYRLMEKIRLQLKNQHGIKISSHIKLTKIFAQNANLFQNKQWLKEIKKCGY